MIRLLLLKEGVVERWFRKDWNDQDLFGRGIFVNTEFALSGELIWICRLALQHVYTCRACIDRSVLGSIGIQLTFYVKIAISY